MNNDFDHIEDSMRKAFDGFELPVSDMDWNAIAKGLPKPEDTKKSPLLGWYSKVKNKWTLTGLLILLLGFISWLVFDNVKKVQATSNKVNNEKSKTTNKPNSNKADDNNNGNANGSGVNANNNPTKITAKTGNGADNSILPSDIEASGKIGNSNAGNKTGKVNQIVVPALPNSPVSQPTALPEPVKPIQITVEPTPEPIQAAPSVLYNPNLFAGLEPFGIQANSIPWPGLITQSLLVTAPRGLTPPTPPNLGWEWYTALQTNFDNSKVQANSGAENWKGVQMNSFRNRQVNIRLESGLTYRFKKFSLGMGGAFETNAYSSNENDTIHVKVPTKSLRYITLQGQTMWLVQKTKDSIIIIRRKTSGSGTWMEIPLQFGHDFNLGNQWKLTTGITLNPGILLGASSAMPNPDAFGAVGQSGRFEYGVDPKTLNSVQNSKDFMHKLRLGNGLQVGIETQRGIINWGLQLQTRYYYTPVWQGGVPLKQNTFNYGINFKMGVTF